jgi:hypothetical protein
MSELNSKVKEEFLALLPPTIYFFVALHVVAFVRVLMLRGTGLPPLSSISIGIAALILGKAVLVSDMLPFINRFPERPLVYNIAWKTSIYLLVSALIHYLERLYDFSRQAGGIIAGNEKLLAEIVWPHFWAIQIVLLVLILMYCTMHELAALSGKKECCGYFSDRAQPRHFKNWLLHRRHWLVIAMLLIGTSRTNRPGASL